MDLISILRKQIDNIVEGDHTPGLQAVLQHVTVAASPLKRGQEASDESAFTDAIYRTNQAFEGSLKEAYRVLAGKDPARTSPFDIETYLQQNQLLRQRVLSQFTNYRQVWRNPSTHDYKLDFDEDEALFAIVTVCAFGIVLSDQIAEKLSFVQAQQTATQSTSASDEPLAERVSIMLADYTTQFNKDHANRFSIRESELAGALAGFLSKTAPDISVTLDAKLSPEGKERLDMLLMDKTSRLLIELKRSKPTESNINQALLQVTRYLNIGDIKDAIIYFYYSHNTGTILRKDCKAEGIETPVMVVYTEPLA